MSSEFAFVAFVFIFGAMAGAFFFGLMAINDFESQAIQRGYALYCPMDGEFAWLGECNE
jgi:hypothetical protein